MTAIVFGCVTCAAVLHAGWNAVLRGGGDRLWSMTLMTIAVAGVTGISAFYVPLPNAASRAYVVASAALHTLYNLSLVRTYRSGDLGQTYPVSRGSSPVLVALGAAAFAHEAITLLSAAGILLVSGGIVSLAFQRGAVRVDFLPAAAATGVLIACYTVVDGIGVRVARDSLAYSNAMFFLWSATMPAVFFALRRRAPAYTGAQTAAAMAGGLVSLVAYGIVIWAMESGAMGAVSALRETSVVYAAVIGRLFLKEELTARRVASCLAIASGAACLAAWSAGERAGTAGGVPLRRILGGVRSKVEATDMTDDARIRAGGCHCGAVRFEATLSGGLDAVRRCTCSFCRMRGAVVAMAEAGGVRLLSGADALTTYRFHTGTAQHFFCSRCGIYTHHRRRSDPSLFAVNVACLDGVSPFDFPEVPVMDGVNHADDTGKPTRRAGTLRFIPAR